MQTAVRKLGADLLNGLAKLSNAKRFNLCVFGGGKRDREKKSDSAPKKCDPEPSSVRKALNRSGKIMKKQTANYPCKYYSRRVFSFYISRQVYELLKSSSTQRLEGNILSALTNSCWSKHKVQIAGDKKNA